MSEIIKLPDDCGYIEWRGNIYPIEDLIRAIRLVDYLGGPTVHDAYSEQELVLFIPIPVGKEINNSILDLIDPIIRDPYEGTETTAVLAIDLLEKDTDHE